MVTSVPSKAGSSLLARNFRQLQWFQQTMQVKNNVCALGCSNRRVFKDSSLGVQRQQSECVRDMASNRLCPG